MKKPIVTIVAAAFVAQGGPVRIAAAASPVPIALRLAPVPGAGPAAPAGATSPAPAEGESFESLVEQARAKYKDKDYVGAVALFEKAYQVQPEAAILFNIGRTYEQANNIDAAIAYYEKFIADESVDMAARDKALERLQALEKIVEIRKKEEARRNPKPDTPPPQDTQPKTTDPKPVGPQPGEPVTQDPLGDQKQPQHNKLLRPIGYTMFGVGAALLVGGGIAGGLARRQYGLFENAETLDEKRDAQKTGERQAAAADGLFIAGGVLAAIGIVLLLVPKGRKSRAAQALRPQLSPSQVGLGYVYRF